MNYMAKEMKFSFEAGNEIGIYVASFGNIL
jgi:hypothetical protein